jgi:hypothetical protein
MTRRFRRERESPFRAVTVRERYDLVKLRGKLLIRDYLLE